MDHCAHARFVWNLAVEQQSWWRPGRLGAPGYLEQCRQLTAARAENLWLAAGSQTVQQQALRDFAKAMSDFFNGTHGRPSWRKTWRNEGFRVVGQRGRQWDVRRLNRHWGEVRIPKIARLMARETDRRKDWCEKLSTSLARRFDIIRIEDLNIRGMMRSAKGTIEAPGRVEKVSPVFTSQRCSACGLVDRKSRESQAVFRCTACGYASNADVNAAKNIAAGRAVTARGGHRTTGPGNREPQLLLQSA